MAATLLSLHRLVTRHRFYQMALCSGLAMSLLLVRIGHTGSFAYRFLVWNLFLAWLPYGAVLTIDAIRTYRPAGWHRTFGQGCLAVAWLAFLPNCPYIVTDLIHLAYSRSPAVWFDAVMLAAFAWTGLWLGVLSLQYMHGLVAARAGRPAGWAFVAGVTGLCGMGIYVGRFLRWNSWDLVLRPGRIASVGLDVLTNPISHAWALEVSAVFAVVTLMTYVTIITMRPQAAEQGRSIGL